nr:hypothetical protein StreXyl84_29200 [Streptomyces sp. Xyl84]
MDRGSAASTASAAGAAWCRVSRAEQAGTSRAAAESSAARAMPRREPAGLVLDLARGTAGESPGGSFGWRFKGSLGRGARLKYIERA